MSQESNNKKNKNPRNKKNASGQSAAQRTLEQLQEDRERRRRSPLLLDPTYPFQAGGGTLGRHRAKSPRLDQKLGKFSLTEKQAKILTFVKQHIEAVGFPPTIRQIASYFSVSAKAAHDHLRAIAKKGYLRLFPGSARGMELIHTDHFPIQDKSDRQVGFEDVTIVPLVGSIAAGVPILAEENVESNLAFPKSFLPPTGTMFALRVKGDSMEKVGIFDGDVAVLTQVDDVNTQVKNGDIVAAMIDGSATLKTFQRKKNRIELIPENDRYRPILIAEKDLASIVGRLVGVYRRY